MANKKTSDYAVLPGGLIPSTWLYDIANPGTLNYKGTHTEVSQNVADTTITGLATTAQNIVDAINEILAGIGGMTFEDLTDQLTTPGKTSLTLSSAPLDPTKVVLVYDGNEARYGALPDGDFTVSGTTITWNDRDQTLRSKAQGGEIWTRYDINVAPTTYWGRSGSDLTPLNIDDNVDMKKGYTQYGDGTTASYAVLRWNNALATKPVFEFSSSLAGSSSNVMRLYVEGANEGAGHHIESKDAEAEQYITTRNAAFACNRAIGYLQDGDTGTGTRKFWTEQYDATTGKLRLIFQTDGVIRSRQDQEFTYDATTLWSRNNTSYPVYQNHYNNNDDIATYYDCYYDGSTIKSSSTTGNVRLWKKDGGFQIDIGNGFVAGASVTFSTAFSIDTSTGNAIFFKDRIYKVYNDNVTNPPSSAQLNAIFGATPGEGFTAYINDNGASLFFYKVVWSGGFWWYFTGNKVI